MNTMEERAKSSDSKAQSIKGFMVFLDEYLK